MTLQNTDPRPPADLLQRIANDPSQDAFVASFPKLREQVLMYLREAGCDFARFANILDLGCGVGRFLYAFQPVLQAGQKMFGCDVHEPCARWCQENIPFAEVEHTSIDPPLPYDSAAFDFAYALSVFTHLRLEMQFKWAWEMHRVIKPGGIFFMTTAGTGFIPMNLEFFASKAKESEFRSLGDEALFMYLSFRGLKDDEGQVQVASAFNYPFVRDVFSGFRILKHLPGSRLAAGQDTYILQREATDYTISQPVLPSGAAKGSPWIQRFSFAGYGEPVQMRFDLNGHKQFRVFPVVETQGLYKVMMTVAIFAGEKLIAEKEISYNEIRVFGNNHYGILELSIPPHYGNLVVHVNARVSVPGTQGRKDAQVRWQFPHFI